MLASGLVVATLRSFFAAGLGLCISSAAACLEDTGLGPALIIDEAPLSEPAAAPLRRLLARQYRSSVAYLLGSEAHAAADPPDDSELNGFSSIAASQHSMTTGLVAHYESSARAIAKAAMGNPDRLAQLAACDRELDGDEACYRSFVSRFGRLAFRRPLAPDEVATFVTLALDAAKLRGTFEAGFELVISSMLQAPSFLFQVELGEPVLLRPGVRALTGYELASRLSFLVLDRTPSAELLDAAEAGTLDTADGVRAWTDELLADPESRAAARSFFSELLVLDELTTIAKDPALFPAFSPSLAASMREETLRLVDHVLWDAALPVTRLISSETTFIDEPLASLYATAMPESPWQETHLPAKQGRRGLLTHASILSRQAHANSTSATYRGLFVMERFLCRTMPPPPPGVITELPPSSAAPTLRDRLAVHQADPVCRACHETADTIGLAFENFDAIGRWRLKENGAVIDPSGQLEGLGSSGNAGSGTSGTAGSGTSGTAGSGTSANAGDGSFADAAGLAELLAGSPELPHCLLRQMFRNSTGHVELKSELRAIDVVFEAWRDAGTTYPALLRELAASDLFRHVGTHAGAPPDEATP
ncbi:MAG: DUF1592 domain-containing protein [Myxococcales bacterium]|nr:DUF1592 domain-containing protein [Myxococcales bacterium]